jgi:hypothetical protein
MSGLANVSFGVLASMAACTVAASVASIVVARPDAGGRPQFKSADLWTTAPVRVDTKLQRFDRLPPVLSTYAMEDLKHPDKGAPVAVAQAVKERSGLSPSQSAQHLNWCTSHYRSFERSSGTFRSFSGDSRLCHSPSEGRSPVAAKAQQTTTATSEWCASRYKSYRPEDNSYQPFEGPRQQCTAPTSSQDMAFND